SCTFLCYWPRHTPSCPLFPYTTLFRSARRGLDLDRVLVHLRDGAVETSGRHDPGPDLQVGLHLLELLLPVALRPEEEGDEEEGQQQQQHAEAITAASRGSGRGQWRHGRVLITSVGECPGALTLGGPPPVDTRGSLGDATGCAQHPTPRIR